MKFKILSLFLAFNSLAFGAPRPSVEDLQLCYDKNKISQFDYHGHTAIALTGNLAAVLQEDNKSLEKIDYIKHDPYLGLYLIKMPTTLIAPFMMDEKDMKTDMWVNVLEDNATQTGHIKSLAGNLGEFDELSYSADKKGLLLCDCCLMVGIAKGGEKFIGNRYLRHFIKYDDVYYGDIGAVFDGVNGDLAVKSVYPFGLVSGKMQAGDKILSVNEIVPKDLRELNEMVLFAPKGSVLRFEILRADKKQLINVELPKAQDYEKSEHEAVKIAIEKALSIKTQSDKNTTKTITKKQTPKPKILNEYDILQKDYGFRLDKAMFITAITPNSPAHLAGFEVGDLIMQVEKKSVKSAKELQNKLNNYRVNHILVERDNFQFFIRLKK